MNTEQLLKIVKVRETAGNPTERWLMSKIKATLESSIEMEKELKMLKNEKTN